MSNETEIDLWKSLVGFEMDEPIRNAKRKKLRLPRKRKKVLIKQFGHRSNKELRGLNEMLKRENDYEWI